MKLKISYLIIAFLCICVVFLYQNNSSTEKMLRNNIKAQTESIKTYKDKFNRTISEKRSIELENSKILKRQDSLKSLIKPYSKPEVVIKWKTKIVYKDTIKITYANPIPFEFNRDFNYNEKWLKFSGSSTNLGITIKENTLQVINDPVLVIGYKRDNIFQSKYANVSIANNNPHLQTSNIESYRIKPKKGFFQKWYVLAGAGFLTGIVIK